MKNLIILDAGHAEKVPGKESPDKSFREWIFNNEMQYLLKSRLEELGFDVFLTNPNPVGVDEMGLSLRANKANSHWVSKGKPNALFYSIHANAFLNKNANGQYLFEFTKYRGPVTFVARNASQKTLKAAAIFQEEIAGAMKEIDDTGNYKRGVMTQNFTVIYKAQMPSLLMEYGFYTNKEDLKILQNNKSELVEATVKAFCRYFSVDYEPKTQAKPTFLRVLCDDLNIRQVADWNAKAIGTVNKGDIYTVVDKVNALNGSTMMYKLKSGVYITASNKYVEIV